MYKMFENIVKLNSIFNFQLSKHIKLQSLFSKPIIANRSNQFQPKCSIRLVRT